MFVPLALFVAIACQPQTQYQTVYTVEQLVLNSGDPVPTFKRETVVKEKLPGKDFGARGP